MNSIVQSILASLITAGVIAGTAATIVYMEPPEIKISAPVIYQPAPEIKIPPVEAPRIDYKALASAIVDGMDESATRKEAAVKARVNDEWCKRMPELASCR